jgi:hypothetical protein
MLGQAEEMVAEIRKRAFVNYAECPPYVGTDIPDFIGYVLIASGDIG